MQRFATLFTPMDVGTSRALHTDCLAFFGHVLHTYDLVISDTLIIREPPSTFHTVPHVTLNITRLNAKATRAPMTTQRMLVHVVVSLLKKYFISMFDTR
jgi:hypothetical protein